MKKRLWFKIVLGIMAAVLLFLSAFVAFLSITEYRPEDRQPAEHLHFGNGHAVSMNGRLTVYSWNIGYAGLDAKTDFFMDGGKTVNPSTNSVKNNLSAVKDFISSNPADAWLLQEVDTNSARTSGINELAEISEVCNGSFALAYNYKCSFVPIPFPPIGKTESGIATFTDGQLLSAPERIALPCPFSWPVSVANLKRCLLVSRLAVENSDKELVLINLHLEAYDDGEGKIAQTRMLTDFLQKEYEKGNYVIAGGDFNQVFPETTDTYPITDGEWTPGVLENSALPDGFQYAFDGDSPSCRLLNKPLDKTSQLYIIDGFILSPNVKLLLVETTELGFANSDHNPVKLQVSLLPQ